MLSKSKLKTLLRLYGFKPKKHCNWRDVMSSGQVCKDGCYYRFRSNHHEFHGGEPKWVYDKSCTRQDFDRWANSTELYAQNIAVLFGYKRINK